MRIFYVLSIILLIAVHAKSQDRTALSSPSQKEETRIIRLYPNPAVSVINFDFQKNYDRSFNFQITSFLGKKVFEVKNVLPKTSVNLNDYNPGVYIYQLRDNTGRVVETGKFQVSR